VDDDESESAALVLGDLQVTDPPPRSPLTPRSSRRFFSRASFTTNMFRSQDDTNNHRNKAVSRNKSKRHSISGGEAMTTAAALRNMIKKATATKKISTEDLSNNTSSSAGGHNKSNSSHKTHNHDKQEQAMVVVATKPTITSPLLQWMETECPRDVVPKILAFCGPQLWVNLHQSSKFWHALVSAEETWRVLCEELYKVCILYCVFGCLFGETISVYNDWLKLFLHPLVHMDVVERRRRRTKVLVA